ncbi:uncharacterized protein SPSK_02852 [Sporothrix schenckii 1099-18]|uniref:Uncharacterized protein n=1 Tax=Sporothrix schenckii 1099-18 TaxID=1397361 RepID=A0A0F2MF06_SPOSC|nr:uncharacterized protein SPSK_02852 [Sporothrix schenckii 1099-18]KJR86741.1 hypothetical protein SPSK_02852 [Sporothrix schenckii 1099-18]
MHPGDVWESSVAKWLVSRPDLARKGRGQICGTKQGLPSENVAPGGPVGGAFWKEHSARTGQNRQLRQPMTVRKEQVAPNKSQKIRQPALAPSGFGRSLCVQSGSSGFW